MRPVAGAAVKTHGRNGALGGAGGSVARQALQTAWKRT
jgi:hypothetical protein